MGLTEQVNAILATANVATNVTCTLLGSGGSTIILFGSLDALEHCHAIQSALVQAIRSGSIQVRVDNVVVAVANEFAAACPDPDTTTAAASTLSPNATQATTSTASGSDGTITAATTSTTLGGVHTTPRGGVDDGNIDTSASNGSSATALNLSSTSLLLVILACVIACCTCVLCIVERNRRQSADQQRKEVIDLLKHVHAMSPGLVKSPDDQQRQSAVDGYDEDHAWMTVRHMVASPASPTIAPWANSPSSPMPNGDESIAWSPPAASVRAASTVSGLHQQLGAANKKVWLPPQQDDSSVTKPAINVHEIEANAGVYMAIRTATNPSDSARRVQHQADENREQIKMRDQEMYAIEEHDDDDDEVVEEKAEEEELREDQDMTDAEEDQEEDGHDFQLPRQHHHMRQLHTEGGASVVDEGDYEEAFGRLTLAGHSEGSTTLDDVDDSGSHEGGHGVYGALHKIPGTVATGSVYAGTSSEDDHLERAFETAIFTEYPRVPSVAPTSQSNIYEKPVIRGDSHGLASHAMPQRDLGLLGPKEVRESNTEDDEYDIASQHQLLQQQYGTTPSPFCNQDAYDMGTASQQDYDVANVALQRNSRDSRCDRDDEYDMAGYKR